MKKRLLLVLAFSISAAASQATKEIDAEIKQLIMKESIAAYKGSCPCPYNADKAGKSCGTRSAYSKLGGASPVCYENDVTQNMVDDYRKHTDNRAMELNRSSHSRKGPRSVHIQHKPGLLVH